MSMAQTIFGRASVLAFVFLFFMPVAHAENADDMQILYLLNRTSYGPTPGEIGVIRTEGIDAYLEQQLHPDRLPRSQELDTRLASLPTLRATLPELAQAFEPPRDNKKELSPDERKALNERQRVILEELAQAKIMRAILSPAQLQEVMVDFWFNHFNVSADKGLDRIFVSGYERDAIRPYVLGKFRDLLQATAHHPAMLFYLDNWLNTDPNSAIARGKKIGINENYAREVMELHTLGVNGGYTQTDVTTLAHILTGWGLGEGKDAADKATFFFDPRRHDYANQLFLNYRIPGGGQEEISMTLDFLAQSPATAQHIAYELAQYFVADEPPKSLVDKMAATFRSSGGDIAATLRAMFHADEFWNPAYAQKKFKPPFRYVVSAFRAVGATPGDTKLLQGAIGQMGEPLYRCQTPNGYSNTNDQWLNSDALLKRIEFSRKLASFLNDGTPQTLQAALGSIWTPNTLTTVGAAPTAMKAALLLSSPEFVYY